MKNETYLRPKIYYSGGGAQNDMYSTQDRTLDLQRGTAARL